MFQYTSSRNRSKGWRSENFIVSEWMYIQFRIKTNTVSYGSSFRKLSREDVRFLVGMRKTTISFGES